MLRVLLLFILAAGFLCGYVDDELTNLWSSISDINHPTLNDYLLIENYLHTGTRPYLDLLREKESLVDANTKRRLKNMLNFKLLGPNQEAPIFELHHLNPTEKTSKRCILLYASFNGVYEQKVRRVLDELKRCGYSGDVLLRIGGFPNVEYGGLKICHVPYSFKVAFLQEAKNRGYKEVLWIDTCMHPICDLESIFSKIEKVGYFFTYAGKLRENETNNLIEAAIALGISNMDYDVIYHAHSSVLGLNMDNPKGQALLEEWYQETARVLPNVTWFPEELSLSVVAWRLALKPHAWFGSIVCGDREIEWLAPLRPTLQFYCDDKR